MQCSHALSYKIKKGDNLYHLARYFQTTVPQILAQNPDIDPYNLQVDSIITICPGDGFMMNGRPSPPSYPAVSRQTPLINEMRLLWEQHVYWTRMLLVSIAERLGDQSDVTNRLLQNPNDIAKLFANYYNASISNNIAKLLTEHLQIGAQLITALRDGQTAKAQELDRQWYINADKMAAAFSSINPYYNRESIQKMLYSHLDLTKQEVASRLAKNYPADISAFDKVEQEAMMMADIFSYGIIRQFPQKFS